MNLSYYFLPWVERTFGAMAQRFHAYFRDVDDPPTNNGVPHEHMVREHLLQATLHLALAKLNGEDQGVDFGHDLDLFEALLEDATFGRNYERAQQKEQLRQRHACMLKALGESINGVTP